MQKKVYGLRILSLYHFHLHLILSLTLPPSLSHFRLILSLETAWSQITTFPLFFDRPELSNRNNSNNNYIDSGFTLEEKEKEEGKTAAAKVAVNCSGGGLQHPLHLIRGVYSASGKKRRPPPNQVKLNNRNYLRILNLQTISTGNHEQCHEE